TLDLSQLADVRRGDAITLTVTPSDVSAAGQSVSTSVTVTADAPGGRPALSIGDVTANEMAGRQVAAGFTVTLSQPSDRPVTVQVQTRDGTALAPQEYDPLALTTLTFMPGQTSQTITVHVKDNQLMGGVETFFVELSNPTNADLARMEA